ncbi:MAG: IMP dehydrogenase, partial [Bacteroidales bacterium]|nr:IMP dehydrogenase [Bacteroidales bacterium]
MISDRIVFEGLTFDDVLLIPAYSQVLPKEVSIRTRFSKNITLSTPLVSAAMDTVTEAELAIAMAREGGIGVIHKNMSIERQMEHVRRVKRAENGMIYDPIVIHRNATVGDAMRLMAEHHIGGIPVVDKNRKLIGIVTNRDLRFQDNMSVPITEVMTSEHLITTKKGGDLQSATQLLQKYKIEKLPVVDEDNILVGLLTYKDITKIKDNPDASKDEMGRLRVAAAVGVNHDTLDKVEKLIAAGVDAVVIDTAHGHSESVLSMVRSVKNTFKNLEVLAGNIATGAAAKALVDCGVDGIKVGIGPGSICTTRVVAGVGVPQLSAILDAAQAVKGTGVPIIADG